MNVVVLDIDRTLIHSVLKCIVKEEWRKHFETLEVDEFVVFLRPHVREFIKFLYDNDFKVGIFTASSREYASEIVEYLFKDRDVLFFFSNNEYEESLDKYNRFKPLEYVADIVDNIGIDKCVIIDDSSTIKKSNGERCYKINPFVVCFDDVPKFYDLSIDDTGLVNCIEWIKDRFKVS